MNSIPSEQRQIKAPPTVVAVSGIVFSILYFSLILLVRLAVPADPNEPGYWLTDPQYRYWVHTALNLIPFAGVAFLWFMAVLRNRMGELEDQFFSTIFIGSGLLFVATLFVAGAIAYGLMETFSAAGGKPAESQSYTISRKIIYILMHVMAVKMSGVFMIVTSTISYRTGIFPRWIVYIGYAVALTMLMSISSFEGITLLFPTWVLLLSAYILVADFQKRRMKDVG